MNNLTISQLMGVILEPSTPTAIRAQALGVYTARVKLVVKERIKGLAQELYAETTGVPNDNLTKMELEIESSKLFERSVTDHQTPDGRRGPFRRTSCDGKISPIPVCSCISHTQPTPDCPVHGFNVEDPIKPEPGEGGCPICGGDDWPNCHGRCV